MLKPQKPAPSSISTSSSYFSSAAVIVLPAPLQRYLSRYTERLRDDPGVVLQASARREGCEEVGLICFEWSRSHVPPPLKRLRCLASIDARTPSFERSDDTHA